MKLRRGLTVLTTAALMAGTLAAVPANASLGTTPDATATKSDGVSTVTLATKNAITGRDKPDLFQDAYALMIDAPAPYVYTTSYGTIRAEEVNWVVTYAMSGDTSCSAGARTMDRGRGDYMITSRATIFSNTGAGSCLVTATVTFDREIAGYPGASYHRSYTLSAPWYIKARAHLSAPKVSARAVTRGAKITLSGSIAGQVGYGHDDLIPSVGNAIDIEARVGSRSWTKVARVTPDSKGNWRTTIKPTSTSTYRAVWCGSKTNVLLSGTSPASKTVSVSSKSPTKVTAKVSRKGSTARMSGTVSIRKAATYNRYKRATVRVQRKSGSKWVTVKKVRTSSKGAWSYSAKATKKKVTYRAVVASTKTVSGSTSKKVVVKR